MKIVVDSLQDPIADSLVNIIKCFSGYEVEKITKENRPKYLDSMNNADLLVQHISEADFRGANTQAFKISQRQPGHQHPLYYRYTFNERNQIDPEKCFPILYITDFEVDHHQSSPDKQSPPDHAFLDSSIWHRAVCIKDPEFFNILNQRLQDFQYWKKKGLYNLVVTLEMLDYHIRMLQEQRLLIKEEGHAFIQLCSWSVETEFEKHFQQERKKEEILPRRFLLVDDYANTALRIFQGEEGSGRTDNAVVPLSKAEFVLDALEKIYEAGAENSGFELDCVTNMKAAEDAVSKKAYDVILLDYILGSQNGQRKRGSELIRRIEEKTNENYEKAPLLKRFWIFSISAFPSALQAEIASGKLDPFEKCYYLHPGADPINTPCLFKYSLLKFLKFQQDEACVHGKNIIESYLDTYLNKQNEAAGVEYIGQMARETYHDLVSMINTIEMLRKDHQERGSLFAKKALAIHPTHQDKDLLQDFHYLIFRIAHETLRSWDKMWDEYLAVKEKLSQKKSETNLNDIRDYIIKLQQEACR